MRLDGKSAFVTGGARGIGMNYATALAEAGANVAIVDMDIQTARETAELYGLQVLENDINEQKSNTTRFAVFSPAACEIKPSDNHFVLLFSCKNQPGALGDAISVISRHDYNLKCLKSHPTGVENWAYYFYAEGEGNLGTEAGQTMRRELERVCNSVRVLGSFSGERMLNRTDA